MELKISKTRNVETPSRGTAKSAGIDLFIPYMDEKFIEDFERKNDRTSAMCIDGWLRINGQSRAIVPLGIKVNFDNFPSSALIAMNRSSIGTSGVVRLACVIDQDYQGEIFASVFNLNNHSIEIEQGKAIVQALHVPVFNYPIVEVPESDLWREETERGKGKLNSTNR